ncbi:MAG TPA: hypothetical protein VKT77_16210 [Chthonomonadaceae bacterium]|nr:hypothetical protein [Chthonomonadaceae bacterium]
MLFAARPAVAGHYDVAYSGGTWDIASASGPYQYGSYGFGYDISDTDTPAFALCSGTITATCTWAPDFDGDDPPASCIVAENTSVSANWDTQETSGGYVAPSGTATVDSGLPEVYSSSSSGDTSGYASKSGYRITVQSGASFTVSCSPDAYAYTATGPAEANVMYVVFATPVTVQLTGTTTFGGNQNILIGQGIFASLNTGDYAQGPWTWTISGDPFDGFQVDENNPTSGHAIELASVLDPDQMHRGYVSYYYRSYGGAPDLAEKHAPSTVRCTATATDGAGHALVVTGQAVVNVWQPSHLVTTVVGHWFIGLVPNVGTVIQVGMDDGTNGVKWTTKVTTPLQFVGAGATGLATGAWANAQLIRPTVSHVTNAGVTEISYNGVEGLDHDFPFRGGTYPSDGTESTQSDAPGEVLNDGWASASYSLPAKTYTLYQPPPGGGGLGVTWVALHKLEWIVSAKAVNNNGWSLLTDPAGTAPPVNGPVVAITADAPFQTLPEWFRIFN